MAGHSASVLGDRWLAAAAQHLADRLDLCFRDRRPIRTEQGAIALARGMAQSLRAAGDALEAAARKLHEAGRGFPANQAMTAAIAARKACEGWT